MSHMSPHYFTSSHMSHPHICHTSQPSHMSHMSPHYVTPSRMSHMSPHCHTLTYVTPHMSHTLTAAVCYSDIDLDPDAPPSKRIREDDGEDETDYSMASLARGEITEVHNTSIL